MHFRAFFGAYVQVVVVVEFPSILEPFDIWPGFASGHANEHNFVAQYVLVIEMRGLCYAGTLEPNREELEMPETKKSILYLQRASFIRSAMLPRTQRYPNKTVADLLMNSIGKQD